MQNENLLGSTDKLTNLLTDRTPHQMEFVKRRLIARDNARKTNSYISAEEMHRKLRTMLEEAKSRD